MKQILRAIVICILGLSIVSCAPPPPLDPGAYNQLLLNIRDFFTITLLLLGKSPIFAQCQAITRLYYGHYHLCRLIYNNIMGRDANNHRDAWDRMQNDIKLYGEKLKEFRIKYDYTPLNFSEPDVRNDLEFILNNKDKFDLMVAELKNSISSFSTDTTFMEVFNKNISEVEESYECVINAIGDILNNS
mgnify:CR=1 FL=1